MTSAATTAAATPTSAPTPLGPVFDPDAFKRWLQQAYVTAFQSSRRQRSTQGNPWRIRTQPKVPVANTYPGGTVLGGMAGPSYSGTPFGAAGRTVLGG